jgi:serine/threonine protein kinase
MVKPGEWCNTLAGTPFYKAPEVMQHQAAIYDFPADVFSSGILLSDMMHPDVCMAGVFQLFSDKDKSRFKKKWQDASRPCFSETLQEIQRRMSDQLPGKRGSMHQTCQELLELARIDPMPHPFWNRQTHLPDGPPQQRCLSPEGAAEIAGRLGYALHCGVNVLLDGCWCPGYVKLISESICPGALTICFQDVDGSHKETMVCPWQFNELLRPNPSAVQLFQISPIPRRNKSEGRNKRAESSRPKTPSSKQVKTDAPVANPGKQCCSIL